MASLSVGVRRRAASGHTRGRWCDEAVPQAEKDAALQRGRRRGLLVPTEAALLLASGKIEDR